jgi:thiol-disulfide isomerase/thioredoxin
MQYSAHPELSLSLKRDDNPRESPYDIAMGKASRTKQDVDRRARIAAQREAQRRAEQRKRIYLAGGSILTVAIVVVAIVLWRLNTGAASAAAAPTGSALTAVTNKIEDIPSSVTDKVGNGGVDTSTFKSTETSAEVSSAASAGNFFGTVNSSTALTSGGKPEVLFMGGEYCPYCAAERWAMVNALSRFGTFKNLGTTHSSSTDIDANTPTFTFYKSTYTSNYINFTSVEEYTNVSNGSGGYTTLQTPTSAEQTIGQAYDPDGSIPFLDFGNKYVEVGNLAPLDPSLLAGKTYSQIAAAMASPSGSTLGEAEDGNANYITAAICKMTNNQPAKACTPAIQKLQADFAS